MAAALTELQPVPSVDVTAAVSELFVGMKRPDLSGLVQHKKPLARCRKWLCGTSDGFDLTSCLAAVGQRSHIVVVMMMMMMHFGRKKADSESLWASCEPVVSVLVDSEAFWLWNWIFVLFRGGRWFPKFPHCHLYVNTTPGKDEDSATYFDPEHSTVLVDSERPPDALQFQTCLDQFVSFLAVYSVLLKRPFLCFILPLLFKPARNVLWQ